MACGWSHRGCKTQQSGQICDMKANRLIWSGVMAAMLLALTGCVARTWEDRYAIIEAAPPVGSHYRRAYKYGNEIPPPVNPRIKIEGEGLRLLLDQMRSR